MTTIKTATHQAVINIAMSDDSLWYPAFAYINFLIATCRFFLYDKLIKAL